MLDQVVAVGTRLTLERVGGFLGDPESVHITTNPPWETSLGALCTVCVRHTASLRDRAGFDALCTVGATRGLGVDRAAHPHQCRRQRVAGPGIGQLGGIEPIALGEEIDHLQDEPDLAALVI